MAKSPKKPGVAGDEKSDPQLPPPAGAASGTEPLLPAAARGIVPPKSPEPITTFADLGVPLRLFLADHTRAMGHEENIQCGFCGQRALHGLELGELFPYFDGDEPQFTVRCEICAAQHRFNACDPDARPNCACGAALQFPRRNGKYLYCCYPCLAAGRAYFTHDVWSENAPQADLVELTRTPNFYARQGERWPLCCGAAMSYVGRWFHIHFELNAPDGDGIAMLERIIDWHPQAERTRETAEMLWNAMEDDTDFNVFQCQICGRLQANEDSG